MIFSRLAAPAFFGALLFASLQSRAAFPETALQPISLKVIHSPTTITHAPDGSGRLFVCDQPGKIYVIQGAIMLPTPFLDITGRTVTQTTGYNERGLLGLAFHPGYANAASPGFGKFYVYYNKPYVAGTDPAPPQVGDPVTSVTVVAEFQVSAANPDQADPASERRLLLFTRPQSNHNGGQLEFGPDGFLYIGSGDGGSQQDNNAGHTGGSVSRPTDNLGNGQDKTRYLGKILRIDPLDPDGAGPLTYGIPASNPFFNDPTPGIKKEIYSYGMRNPWRFSFDKRPGGTNRLFCGDVGGDRIEEVDIIVAGGNYGWRYKEGFEFPTFSSGAATNPMTIPQADLDALVDPIAQYAHPGAVTSPPLPQLGVSITGGFVYRGSAIPALQGKYVFGDYGTTSGASDGRMMGLEETAPGSGVFTLTQAIPFRGTANPIVGQRILCLGEDEAGEIYLGLKTNAGVLALGTDGLPAGGIYKIVPVQTVTKTLAPAKDNTIFSEDVPLARSYSDALGYLYAGRTGTVWGPYIRRALLAFDVAGAVPAGTTIDTASLKLTAAKAGAAASGTTVTLYRVDQAWGEGTSYNETGGYGSPATPGDATWMWSAYNTVSWTAGCSFSAPPSALTTFTGAPLNFATAQFKADVQSCLDTPANNFGWIVIANETTNNSAIQFSSKDQGATPPALEISYQAPAEVDATAPVVTPPASVTVEAASASGAAVTYPPATATDNVAVASLTYSKASGSVFPLGITTVTAKAKDTGNNVGTATFTVTVQDTTMPAVTPPENVIAEATSASGAAVSYPAAMTSDEVGVTSVMYSQDTGTTFPIGSTMVTVTAKDAANNTGTATFTVTVQDTTPPTASVAANLSVAAGPTGVVALGDLRSNVTQSDAVGVASVVQSPDATTVEPLGTYPVTFTVKDAANNTTIVQTMVTVAFAPAVDPKITASAKAGPIAKGVATGAPAPGAGSGGLPQDATLGEFFTPAISDFHDLAARATLLAGKKKLGAIYVEDGAGTGSLAAFQGKQADGLANGVTFKSFLDPVLAPGGAIAFGAKVNGLKSAEDEAVWTDALGGGLQPVLHEGHDVSGLPPGTTLKSVTSLSLRDGELIALLKLNKAPGLVTARDDVVLLRLTASAANVLLRTGNPTNGPIALAITAFVPGQFSKGQGRTHSGGGVVARVKTDTDGDQLVLIDDDGTKHVLLSTAAADAALGAQAMKMSIPATAGTGTAARITAKLLAGTKACDSVIFSATNQPFSHRKSAGDAIPGGGANFASFADPVVNDAPRAIFLAKIDGDGIKAPANTALFDWDAAYALGEIVRTGSPATARDGTELTGAAWKTFSNFALPDGAGAGVIFTAELTGQAVAATNKLGLWAEDSTGLIRLLLRGGQDVTIAPGVTKPLASFRLLDALPGSFGSRRSYNSNRSVAVLATFTDKTQALLRIDIP